MFTVAVPPAGTVVGGVPLTAKSPVVVMLLMVRGSVPLLVKVKATAGLVLPTVRVPKM